MTTSEIAVVERFIKRELDQIHRALDAMRRENREDHEAVRQELRNLSDRLELVEREDADEKAVRSAVTHWLARAAVLVAIGSGLAALIAQAVQALT